MMHWRYSSSIITQNYQINVFGHRVIRFVADIASCVSFAGVLDHEIARVYECC